MPKSHTDTPLPTEHLAGADDTVGLTAPDHGLAALCLGAAAVVRSADVDDGAPIVGESGMGRRA